jgi:murein DD-endopeptidase MepM/ murein hydrolase activator NlpD
VNLVLRRLVLVVALFLVWAPAAKAWSWPVQGPVLQPFVYDEAHPYDAGQHRGIDIGADTAGELVIAPEAGTVSFAGTVPTSGKCLTIQTPDGYSVTLTHLGSIQVAKGAAVGEGDAVGTIGPSGTPEFAQPYVHFGIRTTPDPNGYLDPLGFLPAISASDPTQTTTTPQPSASVTSAGSATARPATRGSQARTTKTHTGSHHGRGSQSRSAKSAADESSTAASTAPRSARGGRSSGRHSSRRSVSGTADRRHSPMPHRRLDEPTTAWRRPVVEAAAPDRTGLGTGHEIGLGVPVSPARPLRARSNGSVLPLVLNGAAALVAVAAASACARRRRTVASDPLAGAEILRLSPPGECGPVREAA